MVGRGGEAPEQQQQSVEAKTMTSGRQRRETAAARGGGDCCGEAWGDALARGDNRSEALKKKRKKKKARKRRRVSRLAQAAGRDAVGNAGETGNFDSTAIISTAAAVAKKEKQGEAAAAAVAEEMQLTSLKKVPTTPAAEPLAEPPTTKPLPTAAA